MEVKWPKVDSTLAARCLGVLYDKENDKDYRILCIHIDDSCFGATIREPEPTPPALWDEYRRCSDREKAALTKDNPSFFTTGDVGIWLKKLSAVRAANHSNKMWLMEAVGILRDHKDYERMKKVTDKLNEFKDVDDETAAVVKQFGGEVIRKTYGGRYDE